MSLAACAVFTARQFRLLLNQKCTASVEELLDTLSGALYFSSLNMTSNYHQLHLTVSDILKTAKISASFWKV
jgi:hypothetical protein